mmetsp:Transcript_35426/g.53272  ORF Transcript_35426/g.53272 Transcript_35426/m.53272 type:complete len:80 (+) Transcript_35426:132-371(+)
MGWSRQSLGDGTWEGEQALSKKGYPSLDSCCTSLVHPHEPNLSVCWRLALHQQGIRMITTEEVRTVVYTTQLLFASQRN